LINQRSEVVWFCLGDEPRAEPDRILPMLKFNNCIVTQRQVIIRRAKVSR
jgi:hypothetical protein